MSYYGNRVQENTATTGTGTITFSGSVAGYQTWAAGFGDDKPCYVQYWIVDGTAWEVGRGMLDASGATLTRTNLEESSTGSLLNLSGSAVVFSGPSSDVIDNAGNGQQTAIRNGWALP